MDYQLLADLLYPQITTMPEDMEQRYPPRNLPEGAKVTRFAPSPTGFLHPLLQTFWNMPLLSATRHFYETLQTQALPLTIWQ